MAKPKLPDVSSLGERPIPQPAGGPIATADVTPIREAQAQTGAAIFELGERLARAEATVRRLEDATEAAAILGEFRSREAEELRRVSTEQDFSRVQALQQYGEALRRRVEEALRNYSGTPEARARLAQQLSDDRSRFATQAAALNAQEARARVLSTMEGRLNTLVADAHQNPAGLVEHFDRWAEEVEAVSPALTGEEQTTRLRAGQEILAEAAIGSMITRGAFAAAAEALEIPGMDAILSPPAQNRLRTRIQEARARMAAAEEAGRQKLAEKETILGRPLTEGERVRAAGLEPRAPACRRVEKSASCKARTPNRSSDEQCPLVPPELLPSGATA